MLHRNRSSEGCRPRGCPCGGYSKLMTLHFGAGAPPRAIARELGISHSPALRQLATSFRSRDDEAYVRVRGAAYWMKGCSSLGRLRFAILLAVRSKRSDNGNLCLMRPPPTNGRGAPRDRCGTARGLLGAAVASYCGGCGLLGKRQLEGVAAAKARGAHTGCKATLDPDRIRQCERRLPKCAD